MLKKTKSIVSLIVLLLSVLTYRTEAKTIEVDKSHGFWQDDSVGEKWIDETNYRELEDGFLDFFNETGVWPFLYVTDKYGSGGDFNTFEEAIYDMLFGDCPGNLLFVFIGDEECYYIAAGTGTGDVVNSSTIELFQQRINKYWSNGDLAYIFGHALSDVGKTLNKSTKTESLAKSNRRSMIVFLCVLGVAIVMAIFVVVRLKIRRSRQVIVCPRCHTPISIDSESCPSCGKEFYSNDSS